MKKIVVFTPPQFTEKIIDTMSKAGAGKQGLYSRCAFVLRGEGTFNPEEGANPFVGKVGEISKEPEDRIEMQCEDKFIDAVVKAVREVHPYEEPAIEVYDLELPN